MAFLDRSALSQEQQAGYAGMIMKAVGGLYTVEAPNGVFHSCKARGIFRKDGVSPLVGDYVQLQFEGEEGLITGIYERTSVLTRPPVANLDRLILVNASMEPPPNLLVLDKLIAIAEHKGIEPIIVFTKTDLCVPEELIDLYREAGFRVIAVDNTTGQGVGELRALLEGKLCAFCGNSGVGKSSVLNHLEETLLLETAPISRKLGRGRHTTRHVELYAVAGGLIADTPGFSALDTERYEHIRREELMDCFREFRPFEGECRFRDCAHLKEKGCAVLYAVEEGTIAPSRHRSYVQMMEEAAKICEWERPGGNVQ